MAQYRFNCQCYYATRFRALWRRHNRKGCAVFPPDGS